MVGLLLVERPVRHGPGQNRRLVTARIAGRVFGCDVRLAPGAGARPTAAAVEAEIPGRLEALALARSLVPLRGPEAEAIAPGDARRHHAVLVRVGAARGIEVDEVRAIAALAGHGTHPEAEGERRIAVWQRRAVGNVGHAAAPRVPPRRAKIPPMCGQRTIMRESGRAWMPWQAAMQMP